MSEEHDIGTGMVAAVRVAVANTAHTLTHPIHTAKAILGLEKDKSIPEMIREEQERMLLKRNKVHQ